MLTMITLHRSFSHTVSLSRNKIRIKLFSTKISPSQNETGMNLPNVYSNQIETEWYKWWKVNCVFTPQEEINPQKGRFSMVLPPPNVTGSLHLGHTLTNFIQDAIARWHRMRGKNVLWIPGCDHAGIATQVVVEKMLLSELGKSRHEIGREKFLEHVWTWKEKKEQKIYEQLEKLGSSLDWTKSVFTMDPMMANAVTEAFVRLFNDGLIYRKNDMINWCCYLRSTISDIEIDHINVDGPTKMNIPGYKEPVEFGYLHYVSYKLQGAPENEIEIATTRPETIFGDTAIVVHPKDPRYVKLLNAIAINPLTGRTMKIYTHESVDPNFGTGAVKVTPTHDPSDFLISKDLDFEGVEVIDDYGLMNENCGKFKGLPRFEARKAVVDHLKQTGALTKQISHSTTLPICSRSGDVIEYKLKPQWFVKTKELAQKAVDSVKNGSLEIIPKIHEKSWIDWLTANKDWCISRQLVWGHRIPAYRITSSLTPEKETWVVGRNLDEVKDNCVNKLGLDPKGLKIDQDNDVLDTWFSSALFPFASMGWPKKTKLFNEYYPLDLMETGHDILNFWVSRMVMLGLELTGKLPFNKILLHGIVCDVHGRKMSKSLGNVIDPLDLINGITLEQMHKQSENLFKSGILSKDEYQKAISSQSKDFPNGIPASSADSLRFALCSYDIKAHFINLDIRKVSHYRLFCNKIWQASRFVFKYLEKVNDFSKLNLSSVKNLSPLDKWILSRLSTCVVDANAGFESFDLHHVTRSLYRFFYLDFCDVYLEGVKPILQNSNNDDIERTTCVLLTCLHTSFLALSPFMPFLTEELYQKLPINGKAASIALAPYPRPEEWSCWKDNELEDEMQVINHIIHNVRSVNVTYAFKEKPEVVVTNSNFWKSITNVESILSALLKNSSVKIVNSCDWSVKSNVITRIINPLVSVHLSFKDSKIDGEQQLSRITGRHKTLQLKLEKLIKQINSPKHQKSSQDVKDEFQTKKILLEGKLSEISADLLQLENNVNTKKD